MDVWRPLEHAVCAEKTEMILVPCLYPTKSHFFGRHVIIMHHIRPTPLS